MSQPHNNMVMLRGNLGNDPSVRKTGKGVSVCNFRMATNERYRNADGELVQRTQWHKITVWGNTAELCGKHLTKGREVSVMGKLVTNEWVDKEGYEREDVEIHTTSVEFLRKPSSNPQDEADQDVTSLTEE